MILNKVTLYKIRSFINKTEFEFSDKTFINTISGANGTGKTTLFKSILLAQRAFFSEQIKEANPIKDVLDKDLSNYLLQKDSEIKIEFRVTDSTITHATFSIVCTERSASSFKWKLKCDKKHKEEIIKFWDINNPKKIIVYVDSNRNINESDFSHEGISIKSSNKSDDLAIDYIFNPDQIFTSIYERIIKDYIRERVIPNKPRKDIPHVVSKVFIHKLLRNINVSNFTGLSNDNQFVLQIKSAKQHLRISPYDLRHMSSGEKTIFYILHFICYVKNIGMLIIDEPENNLHENLLAEFIDLLNKICASSNFGELVINTTKASKVKLNEALSKQILAYYEQHNLSSVFLLTHSKNLIYHNFSIGSNYILNEGLHHLVYDETEKELRNLGLSIVNSKVLFVEGKTDNELLENILSPYNIKVKTLGNCSEVIATYKKYLNLKDHIKDVQFCFMIDKDTRGAADIEEIKTADVKLFEKYFIVLDRHEIENYFLDAALFLELYNIHHTLFPELTTPKENDIIKAMKVIADKHKEKVILKTLQNLNQKSFGTLKTLVSGKALPVNSAKDYNNYIDTALSTSSLQATSDIFKGNFKIANQSIKNWDKSGWVDLCDGKIVFNEYVGSLVKAFGVEKKRLVKEISNLSFKENKFTAHKIIKLILEKFEPTIK